MPYLLVDDEVTIEVAEVLVDGAIADMNEAFREIVNTWGEDAFAMAMGMYMQEVDEAAARQMN